VTGVVVYSYGVGGFIYEGGNAGIHASFHGGDTSVPASGRFHGLGATLGGKGGWGIGLLYGLEYQGWFIGEYQGKRGGATAVESSVGGGVLLHQQFGHRLRTISTGSGLYAGAGVITAALLAIEILAASDKMILDKVIKFKAKIKKESLDKNRKLKV
jgi:hypothetical protein